MFLVKETYASFLMCLEPTLTLVSVGYGLLLECCPVPKQKTFMGSGSYREGEGEREL